VKAPSAYGANPTAGYTAGTPALSFASMANLTSVTLTGFYQSLTFTSLANLASIDIDVTTGGLTITDSDNLTSVDVTGSEIGNISITNNDGLATLELDHTTDLNFYGTTADRTYVTHTITGNSEMTSLTSGADKVMTLNVSSNAKLATVDFTGLTDDGTATSSVNPTVDIYSNALVASLASDTDDGLTQYSIDGTNDASDLGSYTTASGMATLKTYLNVVAANVKSDAAVHFDTVSLHNIAADAGATGETEGDQNSGNALTYATNGGEKTNWVGAVLYMTASTYSSVTTNPTQQDIQAEKRAWIMDVSTYTAGTTSINLKIGGTAVFETAGTHGDVTMANVGLDALIAQLKSSAAVSRAASLGATLDIYKGANSAIPAVVFKTGATSTSNWEAYTDAGIAAEQKIMPHSFNGGDGTMVAMVTSYDLFTMTIGGNSITVSVTHDTGSSAVSFVGAAATAAVASALGGNWNATYGAAAGTASGALSFWGTTDASTTSGTMTALALKSANSGSRAYGQTISISHTKASAANVSQITGGTASSTWIDWVIGSDDAQLSATDNTASSVDLILSLEETTASGTAINGAAASVTDGGPDSTLTELSTSKTKTGVLSTTLSSDIFENDAGIYGSIGGGGAGDVRDPEAASEGVATTTTSGSVAAKRTRIHWLG
jgi:hypothetical protein